MAIVLGLLYTNLHILNNLSRYDGMTQAFLCQLNEKSRGSYVLQPVWESQKWDDSSNESIFGTFGCHTPNLVMIVLRHVISFKDESTKT